jgi:hypothetical protein
MSVWEHAEALFAFVYRSAHTPVMARRREFFQPFEGHYQALWWVPQGARLRRIHLQVAVSTAQSIVRSGGHET